MQQNTNTCAYTLRKNDTALHCIALHCTALHGTARHGTAPHRSAVQCSAVHLNWKFALLTFQAILVTQFLEFDRHVYGNYLYPMWTDVLGWSIVLLEFSIIPAVALYKILTTEEDGSFLQVTLYTNAGTHARVYPCTEHTHYYIHAHMHAYTSTHAYTHTRIHAYTHTNIPIYPHTNTLTHIYVCMYVYFHVYT